MKMLFASVLAAGVAALPAAGDAYDSAQHRRGDAGAAASAMKEGRLMPLPEIERRIVPSMKNAKYIGFVFDSASGVYTLKFLRDGNVIWILVDGRSGAVLGRAGG